MLLHVRAIEWTNWPVFLSQSVVPVLLIYYPWYWVIAAVACLEFAWSFVRYRYVSLRAANSAALLVSYTKWPATIAAGIYLFIQHRYMIGVIAVWWPLGLTAPLCAFGQVGKVERLLGMSIGLEDPETTRNRIIEYRLRATELMKQLNFTADMQNEVRMHFLFGRWPEAEVCKFLGDLQSQASPGQHFDPAEIVAVMRQSWGVPTE